MTVVLYGERELLLRAIGDAQLVIAEDVGITKGSDLDVRWRQRTLKTRALAVLDPPEPVKGFRPIDGNFLLFAKDKVPAAWARWAQAHNIKPSAREFPAPENMAAYLASDKSLVRFSPAAAEWYTRVIGTSPLRMDTEMRKLILLGRQSVELDELLELLGSQHDIKAERILRALGTAKALELALEVPVKRAIPLMTYLDKALENRKSGWGLMLKTIRIGADRLQYDYWTGVQMFVHACYKSQQGADQLSTAVTLMEAANVVR